MNSTASSLSSSPPASSPSPLDDRYPTTGEVNSCIDQDITRSPSDHTDAQEPRASEPVNIPDAPTHSVLTVNSSRSFDSLQSCTPIGIGQVPTQPPNQEATLFPQALPVTESKGGSPRSRAVGDEPDCHLQPRVYKQLPTRCTSRSGKSIEVSFTSPQCVRQFLENKFGQLQQNVCKIVCKAWIKVIEPKKQTKSVIKIGWSLFSLISMRALPMSIKY